jgi:hypothetical protein
MPGIVELAGKGELVLGADLGERVLALDKQVIGHGHS